MAAKANQQSLYSSSSWSSILMMISFRSFCYILFVLSIVSSISFLFWSHYNYSASSSCCNSFNSSSSPQQEYQPINLLTYTPAWNHLSFSSISDDDSNDPLPPTPTTQHSKKLLKIALFVKKWPDKNHAGGLERHALNLHLALARKGHEQHIFTTTSSSFATINSSNYSYPSHTNMNFHLSRPTSAGTLDQSIVWKQFQTQNSTGKPFDVIHTESVGLFHTLARNITNLAVSWHGIAYESVHSDIIQELVRSPEEPRSNTLTEKLNRIVEEVKFFQSYAHHVATSDHCGDLLRRIYMIPDGRIHVILNGVDEQVYKPDSKDGKDFRQKFGIPEKSEAGLVLGMAGRLVKDKGHPIMFEALRQIFAEDNNTFRENVYLLVAGDGPWGARYRELGSNVFVLGPLQQTQLAGFYNALDVFVHPTLRGQGLDQTPLEAMQSGKPVMVTRFASITGSAIVGPELGYTFSPTVASLKEALLRVFEDSRGGILKKKGEAARERALKLFTATKMAAAYERLFLCISNNNNFNDNAIDYCKYHPRRSG